MQRPRRAGRLSPCALRRQARPLAARTLQAGARLQHARAARRGQRVVYTTPLKALSNQKLFELRARFGAGRVGLQTGDVSVAIDADVVVMTTEVLRNIMFRVGDAATGATLTLPRAPAPGPRVPVERLGAAVQVAQRSPQGGGRACRHTLRSVAQRRGSYLDRCRRRSAGCRPSVVAPGSVT